MDDCSNHMKALFNGRDITDKTINKFESSTKNTGNVKADGDKEGDKQVLMKYSN